MTARSNGKDDVPLIEAHELAVAFPSDTGETNIAIQGVNLQVQRGEILCLIGPSGCGKSTFLNVAAGLLTPSFGSVTYGELKVTGVNDRVGYITQEDNLLPWRTVARNVEIGLEITNVSKVERVKRVAHALKIVGLEHAGSKYPAQLSGGMRSRASLARTLVLEPETLLMDEPFAALDAQLRASLANQLLEIHARTGVTIVFVTHDLDEAISVGDRILVFEHGPASRIKSEYVVPFDRPRMMRDLRKDARYAELWTALWHDLSMQSKEQVEINA
jgi:NitT/TauT family transport system ATP-binding protein